MYERYATTVDRWVRRLAGPRADTDDLMHDVFVVALRRREEFRAEASVKTWLFRITENVVASRQRRDRVRRWLLWRHTQEVSDLQVASGSPQEEVETRERQVRLYRALDRLPTKYRTALVMYEIEGLPGTEVAELCGVEINALWVRLHRARKKLRAILDGGATNPRQENLDRTAPARQRNEG